MGTKEYTLLEFSMSVDRIAMMCINKSMHIHEKKALQSASKDVSRQRPGLFDCTS